MSSISTPSTGQCGSHQTQMPMSVQARETMMTVETVRYYLRSFEFDEDDVVRAIASGDLVAWNIATALGEGKDRELRIWGPSAEYYAQTGGSRPRKWSWPDVVASFFPASDKTWLTGVQVQHAFNCSSSHVTNLIEARALELVKGTNFYSGPKGSPAIQRESVLKFLEDRVENTMPLDLKSFFTAEAQRRRATSNATKS